MEGITILNTIAYHENSKSYYIMTTILSLLAVAFCIYMLVEAIKNSSVFMFFVSIMPVVLSLALFAGSIAELVFYDDPQYTKTRHEVLISDGVDLKEFNEKYKIIEMRGEIYTIEEIEVEE